MTSRRRPRHQYAVVLLVGAIAASGCGRNIGDGVITEATYPPTTTVSTTPTPETPPSGPIHLHFAGEVLMDPGLLPSAAADGWRAALSSVSTIFTSDDLTIVSLACPAGISGAPALLANSRRCDSAAISSLAEAGVDVVSLAHPHVLDQGPDALLETIGLIEAAGMVVVGAGSTTEEARTTKFVARGGFTISLVAASLDPAPILPADESAPTIHVLNDSDDFSARIVDASSASDYVVAMLHGGTADEQSPSDALVQMADAASAAGADFVAASGAHRLYRLALVDDRPIAYGLGDFVYPRTSDAAADTAIASVTLHPDAAAAACLLEATVQEDGHPELDDPDLAFCP